MKPIHSSLKISRRILVAALAGAPALIGPLEHPVRIGAGAGADPLPSWNDGAAKQRSSMFVAKVTTEGSPDFVPPEQRIATFDNDGTLWVEHPMYTQFAFALDRVKALAPQASGVDDQATLQGGARTAT